MKTKIILFTILLTMMFIPIVNAEFNLTENHYDYLIENVDNVVTRFGQTQELDSTLSVIWCSSSDIIFQTTAQTLTIVSTSIQDDYNIGVGGWTIYISGLDENYTEINEVLALDGITPVTTTKEYLRVYDGMLINSGSSGTNSGEISLRYTTTTNIAGLMLSGRGRCTGAFYTVPSGKTAIMLSSGASSDETLDIHYVFRYRLYGQSWINYGDVWLRGSVFDYSYPNILKVPEKTDIYIAGESSGTDNGNAWITFYVYDNDSKPISKITGNAGIDANLFISMLLLILVSLDIFMMVRKR